MSYFLRDHRLAASIRLVLISAVIMSAFIICNARTFAQTPCGSPVSVPNTPVATPGTPTASGSCDMSVTTDYVGLLSFTSAASASTSAVVTPNIGGTLVNYGFGTTIVDLRNNLDGWQLQASSAGLQNNTTTIPLTITGATSSCTPSNGGSTCVSTTAVPITLGTSPATFLTTGDPANVISGVFQVSTTGSYTFPSDAPTGVYSGTETITLVNAF